MPKKILLVDDTLTIIALEKLILGEKYEYVVARNGKEGCDAARRASPDLILMDLNMPVQNGLDALKSLKADPATAKIPVVIVTTRGEPTSVEQCRAAGCVEFVSKPIESQLLVSTVTRLLEGEFDG